MERRDQPVIPRRRALAAAQAECAPSRLDFAGLPNVLMTPHMSGWTRGTVQRRQQTMADNLARLAEGRPLLNVVRHPG